MKKAAANIIGELINELTFTEEILECSVDIAKNEVTLTVCNSHGVVDKSIILIGGNEYKVKDVIDSKQIIITGNQCPVETEIAIPSPNYLHGTIKAVSDELTQIIKSRDKTTLVYLFEVLKETRNRNPAINLDRMVEIIIFFITVSKEKGELTVDKYREYIDPMSNLAEDFVDKLEESSMIGSIEEEDYDIIPHTIAGFYDRLGHVKNLFNDNYSGVEFRISLPINKNGCDECK